LSISVALFFGVQRMLSSSPSHVTVTSSSDNSPNVVNNSGKVDIQIDSSKKSGKQK
jgi:hypothetical protein